MYFKIYGVILFCPNITITISSAVSFNRTQITLKSEQEFLAGAPNENIVQKHLNIALLTYFRNKTVDIGILLSPKIFLSVQIF